MRLAIPSLQDARHVGFHRGRAHQELLRDLRVSETVHDRSTTSSSVGVRLSHASNTKPACVPGQVHGGFRPAPSRTPREGTHSRQGEWSFGPWGIDEASRVIGGRHDSPVDVRVGDLADDAALQAVHFVLRFVP